MPAGLEFVVVGSGVAAGAVAVSLSQAGRRVGMAPGPEGPSPAGGLVSGSALERLPAWVRELPIERLVADRRILLLDRDAGVSLDYQDWGWASSHAPDGIVDGRRWSGRLRELAQREGATLLAAPPPPSEATGALRIEEAAAISTPSSDTAGDWTTARRRYPMSSARVDSRFGVTSNSGALWECVLGIAAGEPPAAGFLYSGIDALVVGTIVHASGAPGVSAARSTLDRLVQHPSVGPLVSGSAPAEELVAPAEVGRSPLRPSAGPGWIALGVPPGGGFSTVGGVPAPDRELARGVALAEAVLAAGVRGDSTEDLLRTYRHRLRSVERRAARSPNGIALDPRSSVEYPRLAATTLHALMHESGRPKESIADALQRVRRAAGISWLRLGLDAAAIARSM